MKANASAGRATPRHITREVELPLPPPEVFALLHTPSAIRGWWGAARAIVTSRPGGLWMAAWGANEDAPDYVNIARILIWDPPRRLRLGEFEYFTADGGLPFDAPLETEFVVTPTASGATLRVHQVGFPPDASADSFYTACVVGWQATFEGLARYTRGERAAST